MTGRRPVRVVTLLSLLTIATLLAFASPATATPLSEKRAKAREIAARLERLHPQVDMAVERYNQAQERLATVQQQIGENTAHAQGGRLQPRARQPAAQARAR